ncbi:MAG TPA: pyridoxamine 5'-phosphate oxidase family protein [Parvibaculum sp.]
MNSMPNDPAGQAAELLAAAKMATLATLGAGGYPVASLVAVASRETGAPLLLLSRLALHTRNLAADPRASLLLRNEAADAPMADARVTLIGTVSALAEPSARARFLARHPDAAVYIDFADFGFYTLEIETAHLVAGFGRIVDIRGADMLARLG